MNLCKFTVNGASMIHVQVEEEIVADMSLIGRPGINQLTGKRGR